MKRSSVVLCLAFALATNLNAQKPTRTTVPNFRVPYGIPIGSPPPDAFSSSDNLEPIGFEAPPQYGRVPPAPYRPRYHRRFQGYPGYGGYAPEDSLGTTGAVIGAIAATILLVAIAHP